MSPWPEFRRPEDFSRASAVAWFARIANRILNRTRCRIAGHIHRIIEIEFYYRHSRHDDPFAHGDPVQVHLGRWYFHKTGNSFRGGTFKGVDLTFGDGVARGGILIRGMQSENGMVIDGPSILVDYILRLTGHAAVSDFDRAIGSRVAWDPECPIHLEPASDLGLPVLASARVGLSLLRAGPGSTRPLYLTRPYRFLTEPRITSKGKAQMAVELHRNGVDPRQIHDMTGSPLASVVRYLDAYEAGRRAGRLEDYLGCPLRPLDYCRLAGILSRVR